MADSYIDFGVDAPLEQTDGIFDGLTLDYLSTAHFGVVITNGVTNVKTTLTASDPVQFAVTTSSTLTVTLDFAEIPEYSVLAAADSVRISRTTPVDSLQRSFTDGSVLKASDLTAQHKQLLFCLQEQVDGGVGSLPVDTDGLFDAGSKKIKNLGTAVETHHAVTKEYVDGLALYGAAFGGSDPQYWTFTTHATDDVVGDDRVFDFPESGPPATTVDNMFIVEIGGVIQDPLGYNVTLESDGDYQILLLGGATEIDPNETIIVRNFGVSRNVLGSAYTNLSDTTDALVIERLSASTTANLLKVIDETTAHLVSIDYAGTVRVGSATDEGTNTSITSSKVEVGYFNNSETAGVELLTDAKGHVGISGLSTVSDSAEAISVYRNTTQIFKVAYNGDITTTGGLAASGAISGTTGTFSGAVSGTTGTFTGNVLMDGDTKLELDEYGAGTRGASLETIGTRGRLLLSESGAGTVDALIYCRNGSNPVLDVQGNGKVGIGKNADPAYSLDVSGTFRSSAGAYCSQPVTTSDSTTRIPTTKWVRNHVTAEIPEASGWVKLGPTVVGSNTAPGTVICPVFSDIYAGLKIVITELSCNSSNGESVAFAVKRGSTWTTAWTVTNVDKPNAQGTSAVLEVWGTDYHVDTGGIGWSSYPTTTHTYDGGGAGGSFTPGGFSKNGTAIKQLRISGCGHNWYGRLTAYGFIA